MNTRLYTFTNFYLNTISQGLQPLHVLGELTKKYGYPSSNRYFQSYIDSDKTVISLNGGMHVDIKDKIQRLASCSVITNPETGANESLPYTGFNESEEALGGLLTSVGIIVPERLWNAQAAEFNEDNTIRAYAAAVDDGDSTLTYYYPIGTPEFDLITLLKSCSLAR